MTKSAKKETDEQSLRDEILHLNKNLKYLTSCFTELTVEVKTSREVDEENQKFLHDIIKQLLSDNKQEKKQTWDVIVKIVDWALRIGIIIVGAAFGFKLVSSAFGF